MRPLWRPYLQNTQGLIFVVDSNDHERIEEAAELLSKTLNEEGLEHAVLLVFAHKQDLPNAMSVSEISNKLGLPNLGQSRKWHIQGSTLSTGLYEGLDWLSKALS